MDFKEFSEFPDLEEEDFDIKSGFMGSEENNNDPNTALEEDNLDDVFDMDTPEGQEDYELEEDSLDDVFDMDTPEEQEDSILEEDSLEDVFNTSEKNNDDVNIDLIELIGLLEDDEFANIEELYGITQEEYMHPTKEVLEKLKNHLANKRSHHL